MNRHPGFYHVKYQGKWIVAEWKNQFEIERSGFVWIYGMLIMGSDFPDEINETRIPSPDDEIKYHTVTVDRFREYKVGEVIYGICQGNLAYTKLKKGDVLNKNYHWLTKLEHANLCHLLINAPTH